MNKMNGNEMKSFCWFSFIAYNLILITSREDKDREEREEAEAKMLQIMWSAIL